MGNPGPLFCFQSDRNLVCDPIQIQVNGFFHIQGLIDIKIQNLLMVLRSLPHLEAVCLDSAQRFDDNQQFMESRIRQEGNSRVRAALEQDREFLDSIQLEMSTARQFVLALRFKNEKDNQIFSRINDAQKALHDEGFEAWRMGKPEIKRMLALYFESSMTGDQIPDVEGMENFDLDKARSIVL